MEVRVGYRPRGRRRIRIMCQQSWAELPLLSSASLPTPFTDSCFCSGEGDRATGRNTDVLLFISRLLWDKVRGGEAGRGDLLLPGLSAEPHNFLEP